MQSPIVCAAGEGEHVFYDGGLLTFKATGEQTAGALLAFEVRMPGGKATPLHVHPEADEMLHLLEGRIRVHLDGHDDAVVDAGGLALIPRGTPHAFVVESGEARIFVFFTPASAVSEEFFRLAGERANDPTLTPPPASPEQFAAAAERAGLRVLGPPPFAPGEQLAVPARS
jgi:quercetin dioxygenase-like cupin family protein